MEKCPLLVAIKTNHQNFRTCLETATITGMTLGTEPHSLLGAKSVASCNIHYGKLLSLQKSKHMYTHKQIFKSKEKSKLNHSTCKPRMIGQQWSVCCTIAQLANNSNKIALLLSSFSIDSPCLAKKTQSDDELIKLCACDFYLASFACLLPQSEYLATLPGMMLQTCCLNYLQLHIRT